MLKRNDKECTFTKNKHTVDVSSIAITEDIDAYLEIFILENN